MKHRKFTALEKAYYKRHPPAATSPTKQLLLRAKGKFRSGKRKLHDWFMRHLHQYSVNRTGLSSTELKSGIGLGFIGGSTGKITRKGWKALHSWRRRKGVCMPSPHMRTSTKTWG
jgi:hypothetical protein